MSSKKKKSSEVRPSLQQHLLWKTCSHPRNLQENQGSSTGLPCLPLAQETAGLIPPRIQDPLCPEYSPLSLPRLLGTAGASSRIPQRFPGAGTARLRGAGTPRAQKKGKNASTPEGRSWESCKNPLTKSFPPPKSSREASPKIPQEEAASLTTRGVLSALPLAASPPPLQENQNLSPPARLEPRHLHFSPPSLETEREKHAEGELEKAQVPFFKGGRLVGIPGSLNLGVNTFPWLGAFSLFLNFRTGAVTAPPYFPLGKGGQIPQAKEQTPMLEEKKKTLKTTSGKKNPQKKLLKLK